MAVKQQNIGDDDIQWLMNQMRILKRRVSQLENDRNPTLPIYDSTNFPIDAVNGQVALDATLKEAWAYTNGVWWPIGGTAGPWYYFGTPGEDNSLGDTDSYLALNPAPYDTDGIPYINGWTNSFADNTGPGRYRLESTGDIGIYGGYTGGADDTQVSTLVGMPGTLGGFDYPDDGSASDGSSMFTFSVKADMSFWIKRTALV